MNYDLAKALKDEAGDLVDIEPLSFDTDEAAEAMANAVAKRIAERLSDGLRPAGGPMPARKSDGLPRGSGTRSAKSIRVRRRVGNDFVIAAEDEDPGQMARILRGIPLEIPDDKTTEAELTAALDSAWNADD